MTYLLRLYKFCLFIIVGLWLVSPSNFSIAQEASLAPPNTPSVNIEICKLHPGNPLLNIPSGSYLNLMSCEPCQTNDTDYGCVFNPLLSVNYAPASHTLQTLDGNGNVIESILTLDVESEYLPNVLAKEFGTVESNEVAREAVVVAARSYIYAHMNDRKDQIANGGASYLIDNSTNFQAFILDAFNSKIGQAPDAEALYLAALNNKSYLTYADQWDLPNSEFHNWPNDRPVFAEYSADIRLQTTANDGLLLGFKRYPASRSVSDPISYENEVFTNGNGHGLSQNGSSRWGYGNSGTFYSNNFGYYNNSNILDNTEVWPVRWLDSDKMLFHYYTGTELRNRSGTVISPDNRWNILDIDWGTVIEPDAVYQDDSLDGLSLSATNTGSRNGGIAMMTIQNTGVTVWDCNAIEVRYSWQKVEGDALRWVSADKLPLTDCTSVAPGESFDQQLLLTLPPFMAGDIAYVLTFDLAMDMPMLYYPFTTHRVSFSSAGWRPWQFRATINCPFFPCGYLSNSLSLHRSDLQSSQGVMVGVQMLTGDNHLNVTVDASFGTAGQITVYDAAGHPLGSAAIAANADSVIVPLDATLFDSTIRDLTLKFAPDSATPQAITLDSRFDIVGGLAGYNDDHASDNRGQYEVSLFVPEDGDYVVSTGKTNDVNGNLNLIILELARPADDNIIYSDLYLGLTAGAPNATTAPVTLNAGWHVLRFLYSAEYRDNGGDYIWGTISEAPPIALSVGLQMVAAAHASLWRPFMAVFIGVILTLYWRKSV